MNTVLNNSDTGKTGGHMGKTILLAALGLVLLVVALWQWALPAWRANAVGGSDSPTPAALWHAHGIDDYQFDLQVSCFCLYELVRPVRVVVTDGTVSSITYLDDGTAADLALFNGFATIDQLLAQLAERQAQDPVKFDVRYDEVWGVPLSADIDISELMADEELAFTVTNFTPLP